MADPVCETEHEKLVAIIDRRVTACKTDIAGELHRMNDTLVGISKAFPLDSDKNPDFTGHRTYHEGLLRAAEAQERFWNEMRLDIAKKGAWGILIVLVGFLIIGIQVKLAIFTGHLPPTP